MLHAQLYFLFVFEARNLIFLLFGVNTVLVLVLVRNVAGYLIRGEAQVAYNLMLPHEDNVLNKFRIWKERHIQMRENRCSHLVG